MESNEVISVIVPIFNAAETIHKCFASIQAQTYSNLEIILVDDGSVDNSGAICDEFSLVDDRVRVIHKKNGGVSSARNAGIDLATGELIMFVDADDWLAPNLCAALLSTMKDTDLVIGGYTQVTLGATTKLCLDAAHFPLHDQIGLYFDDLYRRNLLNCPFAKLYRRDMIATQRYSVSVALGEDFLFNLEYIQKCGLIAIADTGGYYYNCMNANAATKKLRDTDIEQVIELYRAGKRFKETYCKNTHQSNALEERLCLNGIGLMQLLFYSRKRNAEKQQIAKRLLSSTEFLEACNLVRGLPLKYALPRKLCSIQSIKGLQLFFGLKKRMQWFRKAMS